MNSGYIVFTTTKNNPIQEATASEVQQSTNHVKIPQDSRDTF